MAPIKRGFAIEPPDEWAIAFGLGHDSPHLPQDPKRYWAINLKPDVQAALDVARWIYAEQCAEWRAQIIEYKAQLIADGWPVGRHFWEADHIIPVIEGGGQCGLENLRTLCLRCHRQATSALARRRAEARKRAKESETGQVQLLELTTP